METTPSKGGRPPGSDYGRPKSIRFSVEDEALLAALAKRWRCSEAAAARRAVVETAKREGIQIDASEAGST